MSDNGDLIGFVYITNDPKNPHVVLAIVPYPGDNEPGLITARTHLSGRVLHIHVKSLRDWLKVGIAREWKPDE
jgi:hypothetical protein